MKSLFNSNAKSIYIHIPFCRRKCNYCAFISNTNIREYEDVYINSLVNEINNFSSNSEIETIYLGGGTPNLLSLKSLNIIFNALNDKFIIKNNAEITMEFNPKISDLAYMKEVKKLGVNRISLGVQSFNDNILRTLNRIHNAQDVFDAIKNIEHAGFDNYSIDLMYGIFGQNIKNVKLDLSMIKHINPKHVSTYGLKIEEGTPFYNFDKKTLPNEDECADMYLCISETLNNYGYNHYEISNFAKLGFESKHNINYWKNNEYFGFGVAAHGFLNGIRYKNSDDIVSYLNNPLEKEVINQNSSKDNFEETIFLGLRLKEGININAIQHKFGVDLYKQKHEKIDTWLNEGYVLLTDYNLSLTVKGFLISNYILSELIS